MVGGEIWGLEESSLKEKEGWREEKWICPVLHPGHRVVLLAQGWLLSGLGLEGARHPGMEMWRGSHRGSSIQFVSVRNLQVRFL